LTWICFCVGFSKVRGFFLITNYELPISFPHQKNYITKISTFGNYFYLISQFQFEKDCPPSLKATINIFLDFHKEFITKNDFISFLDFLGLRLKFFFLRFLVLRLRLGWTRWTLHTYICLEYYMRFYIIHRFEIYVRISYNILYGIKYMITYQIFVWKSWSCICAP
jgi:hypothetical protein